MAGKNPIVGIKFGVDPQSAGIIKTQLEDLSGKIKLDKLQINIDTNHFNAQLNKLQQDIKKKLGEIKIDLVTKTAGQGGNGVGEGKCTAIPRRWYCAGWITRKRIRSSRC